MMYHLGVTVGLAAVVVTSATPASAVQTAAPAASPELTASIRQAVAGGRANSAGDPQQTAIVATLADIIVTANVAPAQALSSVRLAMAEERCVYENNAWNRWGCAGMASVASSIQTAIGAGPAATVGEGGVATPAPPSTPGGGGADYRSPVGG